MTDWKEFFENGPELNTYFGFRRGWGEQLEVIRGLRSVEGFAAFVAGVPAAEQKEWGDGPLRLELRSYLNALNDDYDHQCNDKETDRQYDAISALLKTVLSWR